MRSPRSTARLINIDCRRKLTAGKMFTEHPHPSGQSAWSVCVTLDTACPQTPLTPGCRARDCFTGPLLTAVLALADSRFVLGGPRPTHAARATS